MVSVSDCTITPKLSVKYLGVRRMMVNMSTVYANKRKFLARAPHPRLRHGDTVLGTDSYQGKLKKTCRLMCLSHMVETRLQNRVQRTCRDGFGLNAVLSTITDIVSNLQRKWCIDSYRYSS